MRYVKFLAISLIILSGCAVYGPPPTPQIPVVNEYHGVKVVDPYQWLENWNDKRVQKWSEKQNAYARHILDNLPEVKELRERITKILTAKSVSYYLLSRREGKLFAIKRQPPLEQPLLVVMPSAEHPESEQVIVNPTKIDPSGSTSIDFYVPRSLATYDKTGYKDFVSMLKAILFGNSSRRMNRRACEAFFNDEANFDLN